MKDVVSYGGGTQSTAMILMALEGELDLKPDFAVFADTGGEPQFIYDYVNYFVDYCKKHYDFDIYVIKHKKGLVHRLLEEKPTISKKGNTRINSAPPFHTIDANGKIGILMRQCTADYKIHPISKFINSKLERNEKYRLWMGISYEERSRMRTSFIKKRTNYYPLVEKRILRMASVKYVVNKGLISPQRSSCYFCPFHSDRYWRFLKRQHPEEFQKAVDFEKAAKARLQKWFETELFIHKSGKPLDEIDFTEPGLGQPKLFPELIDECEGYCGV